MYLIVIVFGGFLGAIGGLGTLTLGYGLGTAALVYACVCLTLPATAIAAQLLTPRPDPHLQDVIKRRVTDS